MQIRTLTALALSLCVIGSARADQSPIRIPETSTESKTRSGLPTSSFDDITRVFLNPALRRVLSNSNGTSCAALQDPQPFQWCVDTGSRTVKMYSVPTGSTSYSWQTVFNINADGTLVGSLLPPGGVLSVAGRSGNVALTSGDVSGLAPSATIDATNASNITSGTIPAARLPTPTSTTLGGILSATAPTNQFQTGNTGGTPTFAQPSFSNLSGFASIAQGGTGATSLPSALLKGAGTSPIAAAVAGTDYLTPNGSGAALTGITPAQVGAVNKAGDTITGDITVAHASLPKYLWQATGNGTDLKTVQSYVGPDGSFNLEFLNDAQTSAWSILSATRTGAGAPTQITLGAPTVLPSFTIGSPQTNIGQLGQLSSPYTASMLNSQTSILRVAVGPITPAYELGVGGTVGSMGAIVGSIWTPAGSYSGSNPSWPDCAGCWYSLNSHATKASLALYTLSGQAVSGANITSANFSIVNCALFVSCAPGSGLDFSYGYVLENDINVYSKAGGVAPSGNAAGFFANFHGDVQNTGALNGFLVGVADATGTGTPKRWKSAYTSNTGAADIFASVGPLAGTASSNSQAINLTSLNSASAALLSSIYNDSFGNISFVSTAGNGATFQVGTNTGGGTLSTGTAGAGIAWKVATVNSSYLVTLTNADVAAITTPGMPNGLRITSNYIDLEGILFTQGVQGIATCTGVTATSVTVKNGIVTHC